MQRTVLAGVALAIAAILPAAVQAQDTIKIGIISA
jgi:hypothetical protein